MQSLRRVVDDLAMAYNQVVLKPVVLHSDDRGDRIY